MSLHLTADFLLPALIALLAGVVFVGEGINALRDREQSDE